MKFYRLTLRIITQISSLLKTHYTFNINRESLFYLIKNYKKFLTYKY